MAARWSAEVGQPLSSRNVLCKKNMYATVHTLYAPSFSANLGSTKHKLRSRRWKRIFALARMVPEQVARTSYELRGVRRISKMDGRLTEGLGKVGGGLAAIF